MNKKKLQQGFTLIELIVSLAVFAVVVTISVGALLSLIAANQQLQTDRTVMTNLSFALDSMAREIRTGTNFYCYYANSKNAGPVKPFKESQTLDPDDVRDCYDANAGSPDVYNGIAFVESGSSISGSLDTKIVYFFDRSEKKIFRRVSGEDALSIVSSGIEIVDAEFYVTGSEPLSSGTTNLDQPTITVWLKASSTKEYEMQTTIVQRVLDI